MRPTEIIYYVILASVALLIGFVFIREGSPIFVKAVTSYVDLIKCAGFRNSYSLNCLVKFTAITFFVGFLVRILLKRFL